MRRIWASGHGFLGDHIIREEEDGAQAGARQDGAREVATVAASTEPVGYGFTDKVEELCKQGGQRRKPDSFTLARCEVPPRPGHPPGHGTKSVPNSGFPLRLATPGPKIRRQPDRVCPGLLCRQASAPPCHLSIQERCAQSDKSPAESRGDYIGVSSRGQGAGQV